MKTITLTRLSDDGKQTLGMLTLIKDNGQPYVCKTLELPWKNNESQISCIPAGSYTCRFTQSARMTSEKGHPVYTYEVLNVPNRAGIRIHAANYFSQLLGCIALGDANSDINGDGESDVINSVATLAAFEQLQKQNDFILTVDATITTTITSV